MHLLPQLPPTPIHVSVPRSEVERGKRTADEAGWSEQAHSKAWLLPGPEHTEEHSALDRIAAGRPPREAGAPKLPALAAHSVSEETPYAELMSSTRLEREL